MKTKKILAIGILITLVCGVGLVIAQENLVKNEKIVMAILIGNIPYT